MDTRATTLDHWNGKEPHSTGTTLAPEKVADDDLYAVIESILGYPVSPEDRPDSVEEIQDRNATYAALRDRQAQVLRKLAEDSG